MTNKTLDMKAANTIRLLAADMVQKANSGHPGLPMGMADVAYILWTKFLKYNPEDPNWLGRDRFILSPGHGSTLLYALLHLAEFGLTLDDLKNFRQWDSMTPGHPEYGHTPGVEVTTGPLGQGFVNGVGMALGAKIFKENYQSSNNLFSGTNIFTITSDGELMEGITHEAASLAGHLGLGNLVYVYDSNSISIEGKTDLTFTESVEKRFEAYNWHVLKIDAHNHSEIIDAVQKGIDETGKPTLIIAKSHIGYGSPNKVGTAGIHGAPLGADELKLTKENLGFSADESFVVSDDVREIFANRIAELKDKYTKWTTAFETWKKSHSEEALRLENSLNKTLPGDLFEQLLSVTSEDAMATRKSSGNVMQKIAELVPGFMGGSADLAPSNNSFLNKFSAIQKGEFGGRNLHFGIREHAMGAIVNGLALYGGFIPFGATFLVFSDYMRHTLRLAAMMKLQSVFVFTHDTIFVGEDGPTHQPIEHMAALRIIPNLVTWRPADAVEVAASWVASLETKDAPSALFLTRQNVPVLDRDSAFNYEAFKKGAYKVKGSSDSPELVILVSGSEVHIAMEAVDKLAVNDRVSVISVPSLDRFKAQSEEYKKSLIPASVKSMITFEVGLSMGWGEIINIPSVHIGLNEYGKSAPAGKLQKEYGFDADSVAEFIKNHLKSR